MSQLKKKFKALILDCDGTLIPNKKDGLPTNGVTRAIEKVSKLMHIGIATSRPLSFSIPIMEHLQLSGPSIISGGAQIVDGKSFKIIKEQRMKREDMLAAISAIKKFNLSYWIQDGSGKDKETVSDLVPQNAIEMAVVGLESDIADKLQYELSKIAGLSAHKTFSWQLDKADLVITHILATKHHGVLEVARLLNIDTHEIIGVGDGYNDFPLLMACGLKVAMGNAVEELKSIADYVAPTVDNDGVADVINRFIL